MNYLAYVGEFSALKQFGFKRSNSGRQIWWPKYEDDRDEPKYEDDRDEEIWVRCTNSNVAVNNRTDAAANLAQWIIDDKGYNESGWWSHFEETKFERWEDLNPEAVPKEEAPEGDFYEIREGFYYITASDLGYWHLRVREDTYDLLSQLIDLKLVEIKDVSEIRTAKKNRT
jgi:hypothetical protein